MNVSQEYAIRNIIGEEKYILLMKMHGGSKFYIEKKQVINTPKGKIYVEKKYYKTTKNLFDYIEKNTK